MYRINFKTFLLRNTAPQLGTSAIEDISGTLYDCLFAPGKPDFAQAEQCLLQVFGTVQTDPDLMKFEQYLAADRAGKGMLKDFSRLLPVSQKGFIQKFRKYYFLTPGEYVNLYRVNRAVQLLQTHVPVKLTEVGLDAGFYDQSHFIRVFKKLSGYTPKEFLKSGIKVNSVQF